MLWHGRFQGWAQSALQGVQWSVLHAGLQGWALGRVAALSPAERAQGSVLHAGDGCMQDCGIQPSREGRGISPACRTAGLSPGESQSCMQDCIAQSCKQARSSRLHAGFMLACRIAAGLRAFCLGKLQSCIRMQEVTLGYDLTRGTHVQSACRIAGVPLPACWIMSNLQEPLALPRLALH